MGSSGALPNTSGSLIVGGNITAGGTISAPTIVGSQINALTNITAETITGVATPQAQSLAGWSFPPEDITGGTILGSSGLAYVIQIRAADGVISNIEMEITVAGTVLTDCYALITNNAGAQIGSGAITADQSVAWTTTGKKTMALTAAQGVTIGDFYRVVFWANSGGTLPSFARAAPADDPLTLNTGLTAANSRWSTANAGMTTVAPPGSFILGAQTRIGTAFYGAFS